ncbi:SLATT domain-containing protein [Providencia sp. PROV196]|uniref:SLATT domain-containing protein n=1 Tax=Providencia sp. PROV196 TaxID=2949897 RepID=UPI00234B2E04|nr:SLATT domain-containing protein [Providencia sp. PROV196]EJD6506512.1 SLATT domain-containing protein [Providencia rettgeri]
MAVKNNKPENQANEPIDSLQKNALNLYQSMRITIDSRFQSGKRLQSLNSFTFIASIIVSLALIFLPLLQFSGIYLHYSANVLSALQIFFAVAILVYSVLISTAQYSIRAKEMTTCADLIKDLSRELKDYIASSKEVNSDTKITKEGLEEFNRRYRDCLRNSENHTDHDYYVVKNTLEMKDVEKQKEGLNWYRKNIWHRVIRLWLRFTVSKQYIFPTFLMFFVLIIITDVLGYTTIIEPFLIKEIS